jgi:hypothetical protein
VIAGIDSADLDKDARPMALKRGGIEIAPSTAPRSCDGRDDAPGDCCRDVLVSRA